MIIINMHFILLMHRHCGNEPNIVIMDATSLAFRKNLDAWQTMQLLQTDEKQKLRFGR
jgi:hypothetical protein